MKCQSPFWASVAGLPEWEQCPHKAVHIVKYIPEYLRNEVRAARTTLGYVNRYPVCQECAQVIRNMAKKLGEWRRWLSLDDEALDPFDA